MFSNFLDRLNGLSWPMEVSSPLGLARWFVLAGVPVGIIALYFLKLRRRPVKVASTLLWRKSLEDLHVNSLFQRLRRNLLLFLQLLAVALAMLALAGLRSKGTGGQGQRYVLMIDNSASMSATDVAPSRLQVAKTKARAVVESMDGDDLAMVISFAETAQVVSNYTGDKRLLLRRIDAIEPTQATTSLREALQVAAGLANPSKQIGEGVVATSAPATPKLYVYTDGGFADVEGFSLGNLEPEVMVIGPPVPPYSSPAEGTPAADARAKIRNPSDNVAIVALQARTTDEKPDVYQLFGRVHNFKAEKVETEAQLLRHTADKPQAEGELIDAIALSLPPQSDQSFKFDIPESGVAELEVKLTVKDALDVDNRAFAIVGNARKAQVLAITADNRYLVDAFNTPTASSIADVRIASPEEAKGEDLAREIRGGRFDLVIYDGVKPETPPEANALYFGSLPPGPAYANPKAVEQPVILDWNISHPLMQYIRDLSLVFVARANVVELPQGATSLIESNKGPLAFTVPREGFTDTVVLFPLLDGTTPNTTWFRYISFPLFLYNCMQALGNVREGTGEETRSPSRQVVLRAETLGKDLTVTSADGRTTERLSRSPQGTFVYNQATDDRPLPRPLGARRPAPVRRQSLRFPRERPGPARAGPRGRSREPGRELQDQDRLQLRRQHLAGRAEEARLVALVRLRGARGLLLEWYIYNKRVYI